MISCADTEDLLEEIVHWSVEDAGQVTVIRNAPSSIAAKLRLPVTVEQGGR